MNLLDKKTTSAFDCVLFGVSRTLPSAMAAPAIILIDSAAHKLHRTNALRAGEVLTATLRDEPWDIAHSPALSHLAVAINSATLIMDPGTLDIIYDMSEHGATALAYSEDARYFATGDNPSVSLFSISLSPSSTTADGVYNLIAKRDDKHKDIVGSLQFSPSSNTLASGSWDRTTVVWSVPELAPIRSLGGHVLDVNVVLFIDSHRLVTGSDDHMMRVWGVDTGACLKMTSEHAEEVKALAISPNRLLLAVGGCGIETLLIDTSTLQVRKTITAGERVHSLAFYDNDTVILGIRGMHMAAYSITSGLPIAEYALHTDPRKLLIISQQTGGLLRLVIIDLR